MVTGSAAAAGSIYQKQNGAWVFFVDIHGEDGSSIHGGTGVPGGALGKVGDWYFRQGNGYVY